MGLSGNNFISEKEITPEDFSRKLKHVVISCDDAEFRDKYGLIGEHENMQLLSCGQSNLEGYEGKYLFVLREISQEELREISLDARVSYLEMLEGVE